MRIFSLGLCLILALLAGSCVSEEVAMPRRETILVVTRAGDEATLSWTPEADAFFAVMYSEGTDKPRKWKVLPGAEQVRGRKGEAVILVDRLRPGANRYYRLQALPSAP